MSGIEKGVRLIARGHGEISMGQNVSIGTPGEVNATDSRIEIGDGCDIASYVTIHCSSSHLRTMGLAKDTEREPILIGAHCFVGTGAVILGGTKVGHHSTIGAGVVLHGQTIPPYSLVLAPAPTIKPGYYAQRG